ncbi:MAG: hypothetical protein JNM56_39195 [Planctomycetia bacterium]|nr:hypothetical protein [Planctomycetia bacterium]
MSHDAERPGWWELHLRHARGEPLSEEEQQQYAAEMARQDHEAAPLGNLDTLKKLRNELDDLLEENTQLRSRLEQLLNMVAESHIKLDSQRRRET